MTVVGFDVAKKSLVGAILGSDGLVLRQGCSVDNTDEALLTWLTVEQNKNDDNLLRIHWLLPLSLAQSSGSIEIAVPRAQPNSHQTDHEGDRPRQEN